MAETGEEAIALCEREQFDLLLIDLGLGIGISGLELARRLRAGGRHRYTPMIALTAYAEDGEDEEALKAGMNDRVTKPVDRENLLRSVAFWCDRSAAEERTPDLSALARQYDHDAEKLRTVHAHYRTEFIQRRLALRAALRAGDEKALSDVRHAFSKCGGNLGTHGSVAYMFSQRGEITFENGDEDKIMEVALEAGAEDVISENGSVVVITTPQSFGAVEDALTAAGLKADSAEVTMHAATQAEITDVDAAQKVMKLIDMLEDLDDVQNVYSNANFSDEVMDALNA